MIRCQKPLYYAVAFVLALLALNIYLHSNKSIRRWRTTPRRQGGRIVKGPVKQAKASLMARQITAADVLARRPVKGGGIPRIFHQSWTSTELPPRFRYWSQTCRETHAAWEWVLWTDQDNLQLVQIYFPWLEAAYRQLPGEIYRADLVRNLYMYIFGGVYADLDTECLQPVEKLEDKYGVLFERPDQKSGVETALFGRMGNNHNFAHSIPNAWMASTPGHPFFLVEILEFMERFNRSKKSWARFFRKWPAAEHLTGPVALRSALLKYGDNKVHHGNIGDEFRALASALPFAASPPRDHRALILPSYLIYPYSWNSDGSTVRRDWCELRKNFDANLCKELLGVASKGAISITYWSHTHTVSGHDQENMRHLQDAGF